MHGKQPLFSICFSFCNPCTKFFEPIPVSIHLSFTSRFLFALELWRGTLFALEQMAGNMYCSSFTLQIQAVVGGMSDQKQQRLLVKGRPHVVVATPGRLKKLLMEDNIPYVHQSLSLQLRFLVIDEV